MAQSFGINLKYLLLFQSISNGKITDYLSLLIKARKQPIWLNSSQVSLQPQFFRTQQLEMKKHQKTELDYGFNHTHLFQTVITYSF